MSLKSSCRLCYERFEKNRVSTWVSSVSDCGSELQKAQQPLKAKPYCAHLSIRDHEVLELISRSGGHSEAKSPMFSPQASLVLIYRASEGVKG
ncbi:hypothetical protein TNCV_2516561 [Trichonephila clavipes]|nr:hypothetical protein TNCV_2516561 [Trichonephila clavipes]